MSTNTTNQIKKLKEDVSRLKTSIVQIQKDFRDLTKQANDFSRRAITKSDEVTLKKIRQNI